MNSYLGVLQENETLCRMNNLFHGIDTDTNYFLHNYVTLEYAFKMST